MKNAWKRETPAAMSKTVTISMAPYCNPADKQYYNVLVMNEMPEGPLRALARRLPLTSALTGIAPGAMGGYAHRMGGGACCTPWAIARTGCCGAWGVGGGGGWRQNQCDFMTPADMPNLVSFLSSTGYQFDTSITQMMRQSGAVLPPIMATITFYGGTPPHVTYVR